VDWAQHVRRVLAILGEDASYSHAGGGGVTVHGMFLAPYQSAVLGDVAIAGSNPRFAAMSADLALVAVNDTITRGGVTYTVVPPIEADDPSGLTVLQLQKA
jgi:hypothetical protein